ncbi:MAG TPA: hypothetical protein DD670_00030 [Planctomycetaceae bacterium]|nr:hypothetical protein [Planctomycetaceae bacterium]
MAKRSADLGSHRLSDVAVGMKARVGSIETMSDSLQVELSDYRRRQRIAAMDNPWKLMDYIPT